jgi:hypothetical protein
MHFKVEHENFLEQYFPRTAQKLLRAMYNYPENISFSPRHYDSTRTTTHSSKIALHKSCDSDICSLSLLYFPDKVVLLSSSLSIRHNFKHWSQFAWTCSRNNEFKSWRVYFIIELKSFVPSKVPTKCSLELWIIKNFNCLKNVDKSFRTKARDET